MATPKNSRTGQARQRPTKKNIFRRHPIVSGVGIYYGGGAVVLAGEKAYNGRHNIVPTARQKGSATRTALHNSTRHATRPKNWHHQVIAGKGGVGTKTLKNSNWHTSTHGVHFTKSLKYHGDTTIDLSKQFRSHQHTTHHVPVAGVAIGAAAVGGAGYAAYRHRKNKKKKG